MIGAGALHDPIAINVFSKFQYFVLNAIFDIYICWMYPALVKAILYVS